MRGKRGRKEEGKRIEEERNKAGGEEGGRRGGGEGEGGRRGGGEGEGGGREGREGGREGGKGEGGGGRGEDIDIVIHVGAKDYINMCTYAASLFTSSLSVTRHCHIDSKNSNNDIIMTSLTNMA